MLYKSTRDPRKAEFNIPNRTNQPTQINVTESALGLDWGGTNSKIKKERLLKSENIII